MPSTVIRSFEYDDQQAILTIRFISGAEYMYYDVPGDVFAQFQAFREKGIFYNQQIKGKFRFERKAG